MGRDMSFGVKQREPEPPDSKWGEGFLAGVICAGVFALWGVCAFRRLL